MQHTLPIRALTLAAALLSAAGGASASTIVDTGVPAGQVVGALALDGNDWYAGQITLAQASSLQSITTHILGTTAGETFTVALYDDGGSVPGSLLYAATATATADGWNGVAGLSGWDLGAGSFWVAVEIDAGDTLGSGSVTGALLDLGAPAPLARTAFNAGGGYQATTQALSFGLRVDAAAAVPEPASWLLLVGGIGAAVFASRRRPS